MARSRRATSDEIRSALRSALIELTAALQKPTAKHAIAERKQQLLTELAIWDAVLQSSANPSGETLSQKLTIDEGLITEASEQADLTVDDLEALSSMFRSLVEVLDSRAESPTASPEVARFVQRGFSRGELKARRFRREFEEAFRIRHASSQKGGTVTTEELAAQLMPHEHAKNPESAVRNLQQGLIRVEREHKRCLQRGIPSPFLKTDEENASE